MRFPSSPRVSTETRGLLIKVDVIRYSLFVGATLPLVGLPA